MFIPKAVYEKLISVYESNFDVARRQTDIGLERVLSAKDSELQAILAAKDQQIDFLREELARYVDLLDHERNRAEAAIDILLVKNGEAGPVRNADLIREAAEREADSGGVPRPAKASESDVMRQVFKNVNSVLEDEDSEPLAKDEIFSHIGGQEVGATR